MLGKWDLKKRQWEVWGYIKRKNINVTVLEEGQLKAKRIERLLKEITTERYSNLKIIQISDTKTVKGHQSNLIQY